MTKFKHLTQEQRYTIETLLASDFTITYIANILKVNKSTISREIKRNSWKEFL